jgi:alanyl-tRNA synthetase
MKGREIRNYFLEFFNKRGHAVVPSSSLVPKEDPTLLFTNAGMVQFKKVFLGEERRDYRRATTSQKCVRAGGKHNDLENVGKTARHHTFFEMLGNFSFGDYFKEGAVDMAWDLLVNEWQVPKDRLWVTIHEGDAEMALGPDDEARRLWKRYLPEDRIVACSTKDNFWQMGDTGPCGPCSEVVIDQGPEMSCGKPDCAVGCDCDRYLELWNLVFMQYNRDESGKLTPLPKPSIDTGMGLERIAAVLQGKSSNFDTDLFAPLFHFIEGASGKGYQQDDQTDMSMRVVADHSRGAAFLIGDGVVPANEGRGYVLRRIIRRAARHGRLLGLSEPFLFRASGIVVDEMKDAFPELEQRREAIAQILQREEERFAETLDKGLRILSEEKYRLEEQGKSVLPGDVVFRLYDTYGFPVDLTADVAQEDGFGIDEEGFQRAMEGQRRRARAAWAGSGEEEIPEIYRRLAGRGVRSDFMGYETLSLKSEVSALLVGGQEVKEVGPGTVVEVLAPRTPFYGEAGGQVGDKGVIIGTDGATVDVMDTLRPVPELIVHRGRLREGRLAVGDEISLQVDEDLRRDTERNHSATHILQSALREVLGDVVQQAGSKVAPDGFRFDYTYPASVGPEELAQVERVANRRIRENKEVHVQHLPYREALALGAIALFDEKYADTVRMVQMGDFSRELCGGTHTRRTGDVGFFKILSDRSIAADRRRVEVVTGRAAVEYVQAMEKRSRRLAAVLKTTPEEFEGKMERLLDRQRELEREIRDLQTRLTSGQSRDLMSEVREVAGIKVLAAEAPVEDVRAMGELSDRLKDRLGSGIVMLGAKSGSKAVLTVSVSKDLQGQFPAGDLVQTAAQKVGGKGGGRPHFAQGGGPHPERLPQALEQLYQAVGERAGK